MNMFPISYKEPLFRPPSEAYSLILQITEGCSWNKCSFCEMYQNKKFTVKKIDLIEQEIKAIALYNPQIKKVFLADGNAMVLSFRRLMTILELIKKYLPQVRRVSAYASARDILSKTKPELSELLNHGLKLLYIGIESGDDRLLKMHNKGETFVSTVRGINRAQNAGMLSSVMILTGLGGKKYSLQHAVKSAEILNEIQPFYASALVLSFPFGRQHFESRFAGDYHGMSVEDLLRELKIFIENLELHQTVFRSDHASNYLILKGILNRDKELLLSRINNALDNPYDAPLRPEWMRGL